MILDGDKHYLHCHKVSWTLWSAELEPRKPVLMIDLVEKRKRGNKGNSWLKLNGLTLQKYFIIKLMQY